MHSHNHAQLLFRSESSEIKKCTLQRGLLLLSSPPPSSCSCYVYFNNTNLSFSSCVCYLSIEFLYVAMQTISTEPISSKKNVSTSPSPQLLLLLLLMLFFISLEFFSVRLFRCKQHQPNANIYLFITLVGAVFLFLFKTREKKLNYSIETPAHNSQIIAPNINSQQQFVCKFVSFYLIFFWLRISELISTSVCEHKHRYISFLRRRRIRNFLL